MPLPGRLLSWGSTWSLTETVYECKCITSMTGHLLGSGNTGKWRHRAHSSLPQEQGCPELMQSQQRDFRNLSKEEGFSFASPLWDIASAVTFLA